MLNGNLLQWVPFKKLFNATLMQALEGKAKDAIMGFKVTRGDYPIVWEILEKQSSQSEDIETTYHRAILNASTSDDLTPVAVVRKRFMESERILKELEQILAQVDEVYAIENETIRIGKEETRGVYTVFGICIICISSRRISIN
ncbi:hypothetical protein FO519_005017 [Halicephalobus sp. NKZ332]|nr:hypothetical protein FO519_005017 [Halicephalobus sp. NKZ332]